jgi:hypothetical protein
MNEVKKCQKILDCYPQEGREYEIRNSPRRIWLQVHRVAVQQPKAEHHPRCRGARHCKLEGRVGG